MKRALPRRLAIASVVAATLWSSPVSAGPNPASADPALPSPADFAAPPRPAGVHVWWHWMDGAISRDGITKDLETMKAQGVAQATILNVGLLGDRDLGVPRVPFASPEWFAMYRWAVTEAARLGITLGVHNCDGWSSSGGPWITPEQSMKQYTWTKTLVTGGGRVDRWLPPPNAVWGFYRDVAVVAYRTAHKPSAFAASSAELRINDAPAALASLVDGNPVSCIPIKVGDRLLIASSSPLDFSRVALHLRRPFTWSNPGEFVTRIDLETSQDGRVFRRLAGISTHGLNRNETLDVPHATARFVRLTVREMSEADAWIPVELGELELLRSGESPAYAPSIPHLGEKTSSVKLEPGAVDTVGTDAAAIAPGDVIDLTAQMSAEGRLQWNAPAGTWAIVRFGYTSTGAMNGPATREGRGLECDKMDPAAVEHHFHAFAEKLIDEAGPEAGKAMKFILIDSWEAGFQNWTAQLPAEFQRRRGYDLRPWLPVLVGETVSSPRESEAVLYDLRRTIADLIRANYYDRFAALLHRRGIELHAEVIYGGTDYPPLDILRATENVDLPMLEFWTSTDQDSRLEYQPVEAPPLDLPTCAAVGYGKPLVGSEAYTGYAHYSETPADLLPFGNRRYAAGINRMILHSSVHQPTEMKPGLTLGRFASHFNRNNLYWPHAASWLEYQARIQSVLGRGTPQFDVLHFLGDQLPQGYMRNASTAVPAGYGVTAINADILTHRVAVVNGRLRLNGSIDAALLSLPPEPVMSFETLQRIEELIREGAHVYGPKPQRPLSLDDVRKTTEFRQLADRIWGSANGATVSQSYGKGTVNWGRPIGDVLAGLGVPPQFRANPANRAEFLFTHRRAGDADVFFIANQTSGTLQRECSFRVGAKTPELWDPLTGRVSRPALFRVDDGQVRLPLRFAPYEGRLVVFRSGLPEKYVVAIESEGHPLFPAAKGEPDELPELVFQEAGATLIAPKSSAYRFTTNDGRTLSVEATAPERVTLDAVHASVELNGPGVDATHARFEVSKLRPLDSYDAPEIRYFSGEAAYRVKFTAPRTDASAKDTWWLDIGGFSAVAEVSLNGEPVGQLWKPGTRIDVTGRLQRENELTVKVVNVWRNRLIGDLAQFGHLKNLETTSPITDFLSSKSPLKPSGLFGPITLTRERRQTVPGF